MARSQAIEQYGAYFSSYTDIDISICAIFDYTVQFASSIVRQLKDDMHANCKLQRMVLDFN